MQNQSLRAVRAVEGPPRSHFDCCTTACGWAAGDIQHVHKSALCDLSIMK